MTACGRAPGRPAATRWWAAVWMLVLGGVWGCTQAAGRYWHGWGMRGMDGTSKLLLPLVWSAAAPLTLPYKHVHSCTAGDGLCG